MIKKLKKPLILLFLVSLAYTCIDPFNPTLNNFKSLLVVDALLTNENSSYSVKLSRTIETQNSVPSVVSGAIINIRSLNGISVDLHETSAGTYTTDSLLFQGEIGDSYILNIKTPDGSEYESDPCLMSPVNQIDSVYFSKDQEILNNGRETQEGIRIFIDTKSSNESKYFRWAYNEWWKFSVPYPKKFNYIDQNTITEVDQIKEICWSSNTSHEIIIQSMESDVTNRIDKKPILFVGSASSNRLLIQYAIEIKQLSLSQKEFEFWDQMRQINESGGDIFEKQPYPIVSNIHSKTHPDEQVLGYFQVSAVKKRMKYITQKDIAGLNLPVYRYDCQRIEVGPSDYPSLPTVPPITFDQIYARYTNGTNFVFIAPVYDSRLRLTKLAFSTIPCALCTFSGTLNKPDFWIDLE